MIATITTTTIIELKGVIGYFYILHFTYPLSVPGAIVCQSRAAHPALITYNMPRATWYEGTAQLLSLTELKSHLFELYFIG